MKVNESVNELGGVLFLMSILHGNHDVREAMGLFHMIPQGATGKSTIELDVWSTNGYTLAVFRPPYNQYPAVNVQVYFPRDNVTLPVLAYGHL